MVWITVAEILPAHTRSITNSISVAFTCLTSFIVTYTFPHMEKAITRHGTFWFYAACSLLGFAFIAIFVPETKGKTEEQLQAYFSRNTEKTEKEKSEKPRNNFKLTSAETRKRLR